MASRETISNFRSTPRNISLTETRNNRAQTSAMNLRQNFEPPRKTPVFGSVSGKSQSKSLSQNTFNVDCFAKSSKAYSSVSRQRSSEGKLLQKDRQLPKNPCRLTNKPRHKLKDFDIKDCIDDPNVDFAPGPDDDVFWEHPRLDYESGINCVAEIAQVPYEKAKEAEDAIRKTIRNDQPGVTLLRVYQTLMSLERIRAVFHTENYDWSRLPKRAIVPVLIQDKLHAVVYTKGMDTSKYVLQPQLGYIGIEPGILPSFPGGLGGSKPLKTNLYESYSRRKTMP